MSNKIEKLIAAYEAERASLTAEMEECVAEMDYGKAHLFFKSLARVNQQLQVFYNLKDKWHDEKKDLVRSIEYWEKLAATAEGYTLRYLTEYIVEEKEKLAALMNTSPQASAGRSVFDALISLLTGKITSCILVFQKSKQLYCYIRLVRKTLVLTVPEIRRHRNSNILEKRHIKHFKRLGFCLYDVKDKLILFAPYTTLDDVKTVQRILACITFDILYFKELDGESYIKYHL